MERLKILNPLGMSWIKFVLTLDVLQCFMVGMEDKLGVNSQGKFTAFLHKISNSLTSLSFMGSSFTSLELSL